jgi:hypothetical protein
MGIGHVAVGLGLKRADPEINAGWLIFAALLSDFLLGWFALAGLETYEAPPDYASRHYLLFTFPWSHGLAAEWVWAALAGLLAWTLTRRGRAAVVVAIAVVSHFVLDGIVHVKGLPLIAGDSPAFGLGLWRHLPAALAVEAALAAAGLWIYLSVARKPLRGAGIGMAIYTVALALFLMIGQASATGTPPRGALVAGWLLSPPIMAGIALRLDRRR